MRTNPTGCLLSFAEQASKAYGLQNLRFCTQLRSACKSKICSKPYGFVSKQPFDLQGSQKRSFCAQWAQPVAVQPLRGNLYPCTASLANPRCCYATSKVCLARSLRDPNSDLAGLAKPPVLRTLASLLLAQLRFRLRSNPSSRLQKLRFCCLLSFANFSYAKVLRTTFGLHSFALQNRRFCTLTNPQGCSASYSATRSRSKLPLHSFAVQVAAYKTGGFVSRRLYLLAQRS